MVHDPSELFGAKGLQDPYPLYDGLRAAGPVCRIGDSQFYAVCDWAAINDAVCRPGDFSSNLAATMMRTVEGTMVPFEMEPWGGPTHVLATADDPAHAVHRKFLLPRLAAKRIGAMEPFIARSAEQLWDDGLRDGRIEWIDAMANPLPMMVVAHLIGLPEEDVESLVAWGYAAAQLPEGLVDQEHLAAASSLVAELTAYMTDHFGRALADPQDNMLGELASACLAGELDTPTARRLLIAVIAGGGESIASLLGSAAWILVSRNDIQRQLRAQPELLGAFIEETLRYEPPFRSHYRHVRHDTSLAGVDLPADSHLLLLWGAANRDPARFEMPSEIRLDRAEAKGHLSFGKGAHFCVGAAQARLEARVGLRLLLDRTSWIEAADVGRWLPSLMVRRLERLELAVTR